MVVPEPTTDEANLRHVTPKTLQKAHYVGLSQIGQPLQVVWRGRSQYPVPEARLAWALDQTLQCNWDLHLADYT
jgi:hypothetical protein